MTRGGGGAMTPLEDRVRDAIRARAAEVPPDAVPPLRLPDRVRTGRAWAGRAWVAPLAAAVGVAAALAVVFALTGVLHSGRSASGHRSGLATLPRYYVGLTFTSGAGSRLRTALHPADQGRHPRHRHRPGSGHRHAALAIRHVRRDQRGG